MTLLQIVLTVPAADGAQLPAQGVLRFTPTKRRVFNGTTVLPKPFQVPLVLGVAQVELAPNDTSWVWRVDEHVSGTVARTIYTNIPSAASVLYTDLVSIDPATLAPTVEATAAWTARADSIETSLAATNAAKLDATTAATTYAAKSVETSKLDASQKGAPSGVAPLGADSLVPDANLPARLTQTALDTAYAPKPALTADPVYAGLYQIGA